MKLIRLSLCIGLFFGLAGPVHGQGNPIVKIYARRTGGVSQGTGFFTTSGGQVITAYHVVQGARKIEIIHERLGTFADIRVDYFSSKYDLAVLQVLNPRTDMPFLNIDHTASVAGQLETSGYPRDGVLQHFSGRATTGSFVDSRRMYDARGNSLFNIGIDVIPVDFTIYSGMSGAPVIGRLGVVGILSGSYNEGGSIAWAIPSKYLSAKYLTAASQPPHAITWPRVSMSAGWRTMLGQVRLSREIGGYYSQLVDDIEDLARTYEEMHQQAQTAHLMLLAHRPVLQTVISDPALRGDFQAANEFLTPTGAKAFGSLRGFFSSSGKMYEAAQRLRVSYSKLIAWISDESGLDKRRGRALVRDIRNLMAEYKGFTGAYGIDNYLGLDTKRLTTSWPRLNRAVEQAKGRPSEQARAQLTFFDAWLPALQQYVSPKALIFMNRDVSKFRRLLQLFEPIVYERR